MKYAKVKVDSGIQINYAETGRADGENVLFLHGWPDSWFTFSRVLQALPPHIHALAIDQRGFGDSSRPEGGYAIDDFAEDVVAFLNAFGLEKPTIVGHSFGTFVGRRLALSHPERVSRLVLVSSGFSSRSEPLLEARDFLKDVQDPLPIDFVREFQSGSAFAQVPEDFFEVAISESLKAPAWVWRQTLDGLLECNDEDQLPQIEVPTLLLWGDQDAVFPGIAGQERLAASIQSSTLRTYTQIGHCPNWECPEQVATDLTTFINT